MVLSGALVLVGSPATAQTNSAVPSGRRYDSRIRLHEAPVFFWAPEQNLQTLQDVPELIERELPIPSDRLPESKNWLKGPRLRTKQEKQQNKNRLLLQSTERKEEGTTSDLRKENDPSGWGWLADDVRARQEKEKETEDGEQNDSKEEDNDVPSPVVLQKKSSEGKTDGIFLDATFKPVSASISTKKKGKEEADDSSLLDGIQNEKKSQRDGPTTAESPLNRISADSSQKQKFGANTAWDYKSLRDGNSKNIVSLSRTEDLLSISRPDLIKGVLGLPLPAIKTDVARDAVTRPKPDRLEIDRRNLDTAARFQPVQAVPVRDLGNASWVGNFPAQTTFGDSTPVTRFTPSRPAESPKALELPKPLATPWLR